MATLVNNVKALRIEDSKQFASPNLIIAIPDELEGDGAYIEKSITLWTTKKGSSSKDDKTIEETEKLLKLATDNDQVTFDGNATGGGTHISNWIEQNKDTPLKEIYQQENGYFRIGEGFNSSVAVGDSKFLKKAESQYNYKHGENFVGVAQAMPTSLLEAIQSKDTTHEGLSRSRAGDYYYSLDGVVYDAVLIDANAYEVEHSEGSFKDVLDNVLAAYAESIQPKDGEATREEIQGFRDSLDTDQPKSYRDFLELIGGASGPKLPSVVANMFKSVVSETTRKTLQLYIFVPETGLTFKATPMKAPAQIYEFNRNFFEYFTTDDIQTRDISQFVHALNLPQISEEDQLTTALEVVGGSLSNIKDPKSIDFDNSATALLHFFRKLLVGRGVRINAKVRNTGYLGSYIREFLPREAKAEEIGEYTQNIIDFGSTKIEQADDLSQVSLDDLPFGDNNDTNNTANEAPAEENPFSSQPAPEDGPAENPFAQASSEQPQNPFASHEASNEEESGFADKNLNPFASKDDDGSTNVNPFEP